MTNTNDRFREHPSPDTLLDLAAGLVPPDERADLLDHLTGCPPCEEEFVQVSADFETGRATRPDDAVVDQALRTLPFPQQTRRPRWQMLVPVAAAAVLAFALLLPPKTDSDGSGMFPLPSPGEELRLRNVDAPGNVLLAAGLDAYSRHNWGEAARLLESADSDGAWTSVRGVYLGSALAMSGRLDEARSVIESLDARMLPDPWGSESRWTLGVIYRRLGETARADSLITALADESGAVGDRARAALDVVN